MAEKQSHLNGAYYGPSIPPPTRSYHRPGRNSDCGCCGCLISFFLQLIGTIVVIVGLAVLIFWLVFRPNRINFYVTDASLTQFNFINNTTTLNYDLALNITIRNPNKKIGIYYDSIEANAFFDGQRFGTVFLTPFYQGHKNTTILSPVFKGQQLVLLGASELSDFNSEKSVGVYDINVKLYLGIRFKLSKVKTWRIKPKIKCDLKVPLSSNGNSVAAFETTKCHIRF
uniref:Late embryogenesis abundant protein LEA-2 subgroup domain-containing protein n=1 Tax=Fagus sylvatica TaxID=28930 RepID=A0A2N9GB02_FAGSY